MVRVAQNDMAVQIYQLLAGQSLYSPCMQPVLKATVTMLMHMGPRGLQLLCHATLAEMINSAAFPGISEGKRPALGNSGHPGLIGQLWQSFT